MSINKLAKEAGLDHYLTVRDFPKQLERFAALVRADLMKQVMDTCEAEYKLYDEMVAQDDAGHEEATAIIHLMRKLDRLRPATGKVERQWVDLTDEEIGKAIGTLLPIIRELNDARAVIAAFKEKNK